MTNRVLISNDMQRLNYTTIHSMFTLIWRLGLLNTDEYAYAASYSIHNIAFMPFRRSYGGAYKYWEHADD